METNYHFQNPAKKRSSFWAGVDSCTYCSMRFGLPCETFTERQLRRFPLLGNNINNKAL